MGSEMCIRDRSPSGSSPSRSRCALSSPSAAARLARHRHVHTWQSSSRTISCSTSCPPPSVLWAQQSGTPSPLRLKHGCRPSIKSRWEPCPSSSVADSLSTAASARSGLRTAPGRGRTSAGRQRPKPRVRRQGLPRGEAEARARGPGVRVGVLRLAVEIARARVGDGRAARRAPRTKRSSTLRWNGYSAAGTDVGEHVRASVIQTLLTLLALSFGTSGAIARIPRVATAQLPRPQTDFLERCKLDDAAVLVRDSLKDGKLSERDLRKLKQSIVHAIPDVFGPYGFANFMRMYCYAASISLPS